MIPRWRVALGALLVGACAALDATVPVASGVVRADFGASTVVLVLTFLSSLFSLFGGKIDKNVKRALEGLRDVVAAVGRQLLEFVKDTGIMIARVVGAVRRLLVQTLRPILASIAKIAVRAYRLLKSVFDPLLRMLARLRHELLRIYDRFLRPILDTIALLRAILNILSRFHVKVAKELDAKLAALEDKLTEPLRVVMRRLNEVADIINRIVTLDGLVQRVALIRSLVRDAEEAWNALLGPKVKGLTKDEAAAHARKAYDRKAPATFGRDLGEFYRSGGGAYAGAIEELVPVWRTAAGLPH